MAYQRPLINESGYKVLSNTDSLIAGASTVLSEQVSTPLTPTSGYGILYAKSDGKIYYMNSSGVERKLK